MVAAVLRWDLTAERLAEQNGHAKVAALLTGLKDAENAPLPVHRRLSKGGAEDEPLDRGEAPRRGAVASH